MYSSTLIFFTIMVFQKEDFTATLMAGRGYDTLQVAQWVLLLTYHCIYCRFLCLLMLWNWQYHFHLFSLELDRKRPPASLPLVNGRESNAGGIDNSMFWLAQISNLQGEKKDNERSDQMRLQTEQMRLQAEHIRRREEREKELVDLADLAIERNVFLMWVWCRLFSTLVNVY